jgi:hypothetical protein
VLLPTDTIAQGGLAARARQYRLVVLIQHAACELVGAIGPRQPRIGL